MQTSFNYQYQDYGSLECPAYPHHLPHHHHQQQQHQAHEQHEQHQQHHRAYQHYQQPQHSQACQLSPDANIVESIYNNHQIAYSQPNAVTSNNNNNNNSIQSPADSFSEQRQQHRPDAAVGAEPSVGFYDAREQHHQAIAYEQQQQQHQFLPIIEQQQHNQQQQVAALYCGNQAQQAFAIGEHGALAAIAASSNHSHAASANGYYDPASGPHGASFVALGGANYALDSDTPTSWNHQYLQKSTFDNHHHHHHPHPHPHHHQTLQQQHHHHHQLESVAGAQAQAQILATPAALASHLAHQQQVELVAASGNHDQLTTAVYHQERPLDGAGLIQEHHQAFLDQQQQQQRQLSHQSCEISSLSAAASSKDDGGQETEEADGDNDEENENENENDDDDDDDDDDNDDYDDTTTEHSSPFTSTRDERRAREANIPLSYRDIVDLTIDQFNEQLAKHNLSEAQLTLIKDIRRRGKNKVAAQSCRKRKMEQIFELQNDVERLASKRKALDCEYSQLVKEYEFLAKEYERIRTISEHHQQQMINQHHHQHLQSSQISCNNHKTFGFCS